MILTLNKQEIICIYQHKIDALFLLGFQSILVINILVYKKFL